MRTRGRTMQVSPANAVYRDTPRYRRWVKRQTAKLVRRLSRACPQDAPTGLRGAVKGYTW